MKNDVLNKINKSLYNQENLINNMYRNKVFLVVNTSNRIEATYKTKRGAEGYIAKNKDFSYFDENFNELVYPYKNCQIVEVKKEDLVGFNNWELWYNELFECSLEHCPIEHIENYIKHVENKELLKYINESIENIKNGKMIHEPKQLQEENKTVEKVKEDNKKEDIKETINNDVQKVVLNEEKNGIEIYFNNKPNEDVRNSLKNNGFRWSKFNKCWYAKQNKDTINFANSLYNKLQEEIKEESEEYKEEKEKQLQEKLKDININDIEKYTINDDLSKRENNISMFRNKEINHTKEIQEYFTIKQNKVLEVLNTCNNKQIEYNLKMSLQKFKKDYYNNYIKQLEHRALNPSWAVTGRAGRNIDKDKKMMNKYDKLLKESSEIIERLNNSIEKCQDDIRKIEKETLKKEIEETAKNTTMPKFNKIKKEYSFMATNKIFDYSDKMQEKIMNECEGYYIFKNWGSYHVYDNEGNDLYNTKTNGKLEDAKKWLLHYLNNKVS